MKYFVLNEALLSNKIYVCFFFLRCQLNIDPKDTRKALKKCSAKLEWQKEAAEMCDCALKAGVE